MPKPRAIVNVILDNDADPEDFLKDQLPDRVSLDRVLSVLSDYGFTVYSFKGGRTLIQLAGYSCFSCKPDFTPLKEEDYNAYMDEALEKLGLLDIAIKRLNLRPSKYDEISDCISVYYTLRIPRYAIDTEGHTFHSVLASHEKYPAIIETEQTPDSDDEPDLKDIALKSVDFTAQLRDLYFQNWSHNEMAKQVSWEPETWIVVTARGWAPLDQVDNLFDVKLLTVGKVSSHYDLSGACTLPCYGYQLLDVIKLIEGHFAVHRKTKAPVDFEALRQEVETFTGRAV